MHTVPNFPRLLSVTGYHTGGVHNDPLPAAYFYLLAPFSGISDVLIVDGGGGVEIREHPTPQFSPYLLGIIWGRPDRGRPAKRPIKFYYRNLFKSGSPRHLPFVSR